MSATAHPSHEKVRIQYDLNFWHLTNRRSTIFTWHQKIKSGCNKIKITGEPLKSPRKKQRGQTLYIGLGLISCLIVVGIFFFYLPYINAKEEAAQKALLDARKAAEKATLDAAAARDREAAASARLAEFQRQNMDARTKAAELQAQERAMRSRMAEAQNIQRANEQARQRAINEQNAANQRAAQQQRIVDELRLQCETTKKLPPSPSREATIYQACTRYDDAVRRQHLEAIQQQYVR